MVKISNARSDRRKCIACGHRTGDGEIWGNTDGIEIDVPICSTCRGRVEWNLDRAMKIHLKAITQSVTMSLAIHKAEMELARVKGIDLEAKRENDGCAPTGSMDCVAEAEGKDKGKWRD